MIDFDEYVGKDVFIVVSSELFDDEILTITKAKITKSNFLWIAKQLNKTAFLDKDKAEKAYEKMYKK